MKHIFMNKNNKIKKDRKHIYPVNSYFGWIVLILCDGVCMNKAIVQFSTKLLILENDRILIHNDQTCTLVLYLNC